MKNLSAKTEDSQFFSGEETDCHTDCAASTTRSLGQTYNLVNYTFGLISY